MESGGYSLVVVQGLLTGEVSLVAQHNGGVAQQGSMGSVVAVPGL